MHSPQAGCGRRTAVWYRAVTRKSIVLIALFLSWGASSAAETLFLKNGSRVAGKLKSCFDGQCLIGSKRVPIDQISIIVIRSDVAIPATAPSDSAVMTDGSVRAARFAGLNLGFVSFDDRDEPRAAVAAIILDRPPANLSSVDVLITRDGTQSSGTVSRCTAASCEFESRTVSRESIRWLGLSQRGSAPPPPPAEDTIFLAAKPAVAARLTALDDKTLRSTRGSFPRSDVTWIYVADVKRDGERPEYEVNDDQPEEPPSTTAAPDLPVKPPPPKKTPPPPSVTPATPPANCKSGPLWTGIIQAHASGVKNGERADMTTKTRVTMREIICPAFMPGTSPLRKIGTLSTFDPTGTVIEQKFTMNGPDISCSGSASEQANPAVRSHVLYRNDSADSSTATTFGFDVPKGRAFYSLGVFMGTGSGIEIVCRSGGVTNSYSTPVGAAPIIGRKPPLAAGPFEDPEVRYLDGGKMIGSAKAGAPVNSQFDTVSFSWAICPEGVQCPQPRPLEDGNAGPPPPRPGSSDPCGDLQRYIGEMKQLADAYKAFQRDYKDAVRKRDVVRDEIYGRTGGLREFLSSFASVLADTGGAGEEYKKLVTLINALADMSGEGGFGDIYAAAVAFGYGPGDLAQKQAEKATVRAAVKAANDYLLQTSDHQGALRIYAATLGRSETLLNQATQGADALSFIQDASDFAEKTSSFADLLQEYFDNQAAADRNQQGMDDINERIRDLQAKIDDARAKCPKGASSRRMAPLRECGDCGSSRFELVEWSNGTADGTSVKNRLQEIAADLNGVKPEVDAAIPYLLPFIDQVTEGMDSQLLRDLANEAAKHMRRVQAKLEHASATWKQLERELPSVIPSGSAAPPRT